MPKEKELTIQQKFNQAVKTLRANARKPDKDGNILLTREEAYGLFKFLEAKIYGKKRRKVKS